MTMEMLAPDGFESWLKGEPVWKKPPGRETTYYVLSFSGGKDSSAQLLKMLENNLYLDEVLYVAISKEMEGMKEHVAELRELVELYGIKFTLLTPEKDFDYYLGEHVKTKGKNKGKKGYKWPDHVNRWCTGMLKKQTVRKYYKTLQKKKDDVVEFIGFAADEQDRIKKAKDSQSFPLDDFDMTEKDALQYCYDRGFNWNGLYEKFNRVSCYLCPLSQLDELKIIFEQYPHHWLEMRALDKKSFKGYEVKFNYKEYLPIIRYFLTYNQKLNLYDINHITLPIKLIIALVFKIEKKGRSFRSDYSLYELEQKFLREFYEEFWEKHFPSNKKDTSKETKFEKTKLFGNKKAV